jgi:hypothetical protein
VSGLEFSGSLFEIIKLLNKFQVLVNCLHLGEIDCSETGHRMGAYQGRGVHVTGVSAAYTFKLNKNIISE